LPQSRKKKKGNKDRETFHGKLKKSTRYERGEKKRGGEKKKENDHRSFQKRDHDAHRPGKNNFTIVHQEKEGKKKKES